MFFSFSDEASYTYLLVALDEFSEDGAFPVSPTFFRFNNGYYFTFVTVTEMLFNLPEAKPRQVNNIEVQYQP